MRSAGGLSPALSQLCGVILRVEVGWVKRSEPIVTLYGDYLMMTAILQHAGD